MKHTLVLFSWITCCTAMNPSLMRKTLPRYHRVMASALFSSSPTENQYIKSYQMNGVGQRNQVEITTNTGHSLCTDIPKKMGGSDAAPQPVETLVAAWMGCTQATALFVGRQMPERVVIERLEFDNIQAFRDERGALQLPIEEKPEVPSRLQRITGTIRVFSRNKKKGVTPEQMELLKEQTEIRCPVANMIISSGCAIDVDWVDGTGDTS
jgi:putative redox protein